jgi:hypothetical protein
VSLKVATREDVLNWGKRKIYDFVSSDGTINIKLQQLSARDLERLIEYEKKTGRASSRALQLVLSAVNEEGNRYLGDDDIDNIEKNMALEALIEVCDFIQANNGMGEKADKEIEKNSFATLS